MTQALTLLATPQAFREHIGVILRNAITSWTKLMPRPEILLFGEDESVAEIPAELGLGHLRDRCLDTSRAWSEFGWPVTTRLREGLERTVAW